MYKIFHNDENVLFNISEFAMPNHEKVIKLMQIYHLNYGKLFKSSLRFIIIYLFCNIIVKWDAVEYDTI